MTIRAGKAFVELTSESIEWKQLAKDREQILKAVFRTLHEWHDRATFLPPGKSGKRPWYVTSGDIDHLEKWAEELDKIAASRPLNQPNTFTCEPK